MMQARYRLVRGAMLAQHSKKSVEHYTPFWIVELCRWVLGGIDTDPCSNAIAQAYIQAATHYTKDNPLWDHTEDPAGGHYLGNVLLNPPGGAYLQQSIAALWWDWLQYQNMRGAIFIGFNQSILATTQDSVSSFSDFLHVHLRRRVRYLNLSEGRLVEGKKPAHYSSIALMSNDQKVTYRFYQAFGPYGAIAQGQL